MAVSINGTTGLAAAATGLSCPAFAVYRSTNQTASDLTVTKVQFNVEELDSQGAFDSTTNFRFTPDVAGWYQVNSCAALTATSLIYGQISLYKNGSVIKRGSAIGVAMNAVSVNLSTLTYLNGTTDYLEISIYADATGSITIEGGQNLTYFNGFLVRAA